MKNDCPSFNHCPTSQLDNDPLIHPVGREGHVPPSSGGGKVSDCGFGLRAEQQFGVRCFLFLGVRCFSLDKMFLQPFDKRVAETSYSKK